MMNGNVLSLSSLVAVALMTASTIGCGKSTARKAQKTFDKDLVGYWAPSPKDGNSSDRTSGVEDVTELAKVTRIDPNGDVFVFEEEKRNFNKVGVVQADGSIFPTPEVSQNESGPVSFVLTKIDINNIKVARTGPASEEIYFKRFTQSQQDEFNKVLAAGTQANNPASPGAVGGPSAAVPGAFDANFVGYWAALNPNENPYKIQSGDEISDDTPIFRVDQNGQVFILASAVDNENGAQPSEVNVGVVQSNGMINLTPEYSRISSVGLMVLIKDLNGQVHVRMIEAQRDSSEVETGKLQDEFEQLELLKLTEEQFNNAVEKRIKKSKTVQAAEQPESVAAAVEEEPQLEAAKSEEPPPQLEVAKSEESPQEEVAQSEEPQVSGNEELEPSPRIPTNDWVRVDPKTWEAYFPIQIYSALFQ